MNPIVFHSRALVANVVLVIWSVTVSNARGGQTCAGISPRVCVERADLSPPVLDTDVTFDTATDPDYPDVTFHTGHSTNAWQVWSQVSASDMTPANLGDLFIDSTGTTDNYTVEIKNPNNGNAGAANLASAVLNDTTSWSGHSSIATGSRITGNLNGNLQVIAAGGSGGALDLTIDGDAVANISAPFVASLSIAGDLSGDIDITESMTGGLNIGGAVASTTIIDIAELAETSLPTYVEFNTAEPRGVLEFAGELILGNGIPPN